VALVEGVDLWQQGNHIEVTSCVVVLRYHSKNTERLQQEGVNNLQNLAEADISAVVAYTNFNAHQVITEYTHVVCE